MIDLAWSEIALIAVVALVVIGPKDLPEAVRGVARGVQKLRRMAGEFRAQADELVREANLDELRQQIHDIRNFNVRDEVEKAVDKDGSLRRSFDDPLRDTYTPPPPAATDQPLPEPLTPHELEVLRLLAAGHANAEIAARLHVAVSTVKTHVNALFGKLGATSRTQAVARARALGLLRD